MPTDNERPVGRVYIPNMPMRKCAATGKTIPSIDVNAAARYGELDIITSGPRTVESRAGFDKLVRLASETISDFDYILVTGDLLVNAYLITYLVQRDIFPTLLRWNRVTRSYDEERLGAL